MFSFNHNRIADWERAEPIADCDCFEEEEDYVFEEIIPTRREKQRRGRPPRSRNHTV